MPSAYSLRWSSKPPHKILRDGEPCGTLSKLEHSGEWIAQIGPAEGIAWTQGRALEKAVRKVDRLASVRMT